MIALLGILIEHWGAVQRDLLTAGLHWHDLGTPRLSLGELVWFVLCAPPGTATHFARSERFSLESHLLAMAVDELRVQTWLNTEDAQRNPADQRYRPTPLPRPGVRRRKRLHGGLLCARRCARRERKEAKRAHAFVSRLERRRTSHPLLP